jgi:hypothetical protein
MDYPEDDTWTVRNIHSRTLRTEYNPELPQTLPPIGAIDATGPRRATRRKKERLWG